MNYLAAMLLVCVPGSTVDVGDIDARAAGINSCTCDRPAADCLRVGHRVGLLAEPPWETLWGIDRCHCRRGIQPLEPWLRKCGCCARRSPWEVQPLEPWLWRCGCAVAYEHDPWREMPLPPLRSGSIWRPVHELSLPANPLAHEPLLRAIGTFDPFGAMGTFDPFGAMGTFDPAGVLGRVPGPIEPLAEPVPEPSTLALLAMGAVAAMRRRRR